MFRNNKKKAGVAAYFTIKSDTLNLETKTENILLEAFGR